MLISKITNGFVIQTFDTDKKEFISQNFEAGDECEYEDVYGNPVEPELLEVDGQEKYLPYDMVQPLMRYIQLLDNDGEQIGILKTKAPDEILDKCFEEYKTIESDNKGIEEFIEYCSNKCTLYKFERFFIDEEKVLEI